MRILQKLFSKKNNRSIVIIDQNIIDKYTHDSAFPFLVSFPRAGSHWIRMIMELYFERPSLVRTFYYPENKNYLTYHTHDLDLKIKRENVIYLYRDPVATIYSQLQYEMEPLENKKAVEHWTDLYSRHLNKWLIEEDFSNQKSIICYESMRDNPVSEFAKICRHLSCHFDERKLKDSMNRISKQEVKKRTAHDPQVIQLGMDYETLRQTFRDEYEHLIWNAICKENKKILDFFEPSLLPKNFHI